MDKSGLSFGETKLIIPIILFLILIIFQAVMFDTISRDISKQIIDAQSVNIQYCLTNHAQSSDKNEIESLVDIILQNASSNVVSLKILNSQNDVVYDEVFTQSLSDVNHLYSKSFSTNGDNSFLMAVSYDLSVIPDSINGAIKLIFVITSILTLLMIVIFALLFFSSTRNKVTDKTDIVDKNALINIYNRQDFKDNILREAIRMKWTGGNLSVIAIGIDDLEGVTADENEDIFKMVYEATVELIIEHIRLFDMLGKFDGDKTIYVCMIDANENDSLIVAERFASAVEESKFYLGGHQEITATICGGVATLSVAKDKLEPSNLDITKIDDLINNANKALLASQIAGRNKITKFSSIVNK